MTGSFVKKFMAEQMKATCEDFVNDLKALSNDDLQFSPDPAARTPFDISYEVALINRRLAKRMSGGTPDPLPQGWIKAPDGYTDKDKAIEDVEAACADLLAAWENTPDDELLRVIPLASGETNPFDLMFLGVYHTGYHDAQLNYIQTALGDSKMHWAEGR
jgi:hypothetical protein